MLHRRKMPRKQSAQNGSSVSLRISNVAKCCMMGTSAHPSQQVRLGSRHKPSVANWYPFSLIGFSLASTLVAYQEMIPRRLFEDEGDHYLTCRWLKTHELQYLPWQEAALLVHGPWNDTPGLFVPTKILVLCFLVIPKPSWDLAQLIALLAWLTPNKASEYHNKLEKLVAC